MTDAKRQRLRAAITGLHAIGVYPSAAKISRAMGRNTASLRGDECVARRAIFKELCIKLRREGWADIEDNRYDWWNT